MTIITRKSKSGNRYTAQIRIQRGRIKHTESKTFSKKSLAAEWKLKRKAELTEAENFDRAVHKGITIKELIQIYIDEQGALTPFKRSKASAMSFLMKQKIAQTDALTATKADFISHARLRREEGVGPSTVNGDFIWLGVVLDYARSIKNIPFNLMVFEDAKKNARKHKLISRSRRKSRRPKVAELKQLLKHFRKQRESSTVPMELIIWFAIYSGRRQAEICRLQRSDFDRDSSTYIVDRIKDPKNNGMKDIVALLPELGWKVVDAVLEQVQADDSGRLFPFNPRTVSKYFTDACKELNFQDLDFHDLRHECASRLAEDDWSLIKIKQVTLHKDLGSLQIYMNVSPRREERLDF